MSQTTVNDGPQPGSGRPFRRGRRWLFAAMIRVAATRGPWPAMSIARLGSSIGAIRRLTRRRLPGWFSTASGMVS